MKKISFIFVLALASLFALASFTTDAHNPTVAERFAGRDKIPQDAAGSYSFDTAHSAIGFRVKHMGLVDVPGYFRDFSGTVNFDAKDVTKSTVQFTAQMTSVDTGVAPRDKHLRTADFFEVEKYPEMSFKSTKVEKKGKNMLVTGDLTMKGVTKQVSIPFKIAGFLPADQRSGGKMGVTAETVINRRDFGVNYGSNMPNGVAVLSDNITVNLQIEANKAKAQQ